MFLGIEIGGTKLQLGVGPGDGTLRGFIRRPVDVAAGAEGIRRQIEEAVPELLQQAGVTMQDVRGMAYGFGGPVDDANRCVVKSHQVAGWDGFPLASWSESRLGLACVLGNDCDVAALAEARFGAGRGCNPIFYVTVGSGIGGGLVLDGQIYRGTGRGAAEIGHLRMRGRHVCPQTGRWTEFGPLEDYASGWAIQRSAAARLRDEPERSSLLRELSLDRLTVQAIGEAARKGDALACEVLEEAVGYLAWGICQVIALLAPQCIVIGGGVSLLGEDLFFGPLRTAVSKQVFRPFADLFTIRPADLGEEVVVHGALALARSRFGDERD